MKPFLWVTFFLLFLFGLNTLIPRPEILQVFDCVAGTVVLWFACWSFDRMEKGEQ